MTLRTPLTPRTGGGPSLSRVLLPTLATALLVAGCAGGDRGESVCIRGFDDWAPGSGSVLTVALDPAAPLPPPGLRSPIPTTRGADDPRPFPFFRIGALLRLEGGTLAVLDQGSQELHFFDDTGARTATVGGRGDGPGSFRSAGRLLALGPDTVGVTDGSLRRLTVFGPGGELVRVTPLPEGGGPNAPGQGAPSILGSRAGGGWVGRVPLEVTPGAALVYQDSMAVVLLDSRGEVERVLGRHPDGDRWNLGARSAMVGGAPLAGADRLDASRPTLVAPLPGGVAMARSDRFGVAVMNEEGVVLRRIALEAPCRPYTDEVAERSIEFRVAGLRMSDPGGGAGASVPMAADMAAEVRAFYREAPRVPHLSPLDRLEGGSDGSLWIRAFTPSWEEGEDALWVAIGPDGREVGRMTTPRSFRALGATVRGLEGVLPDALGEESLVEFRLPD